MEEEEEKQRERQLLNNRRQFISNYFVLRIAKLSSARLRKLNRNSAFKALQLWLPTATNVNKGHRSKT